MSFGDHAVLWLHVSAAIFTIGPGTAAIMSTPRYIRKQDTVVVGFLHRTTRIYTFASLLTLIFGLILTGMTHKFSQWWISVSLTLFIVAFVLLLIILRDQHKALRMLEAAEKGAVPAAEDSLRSADAEEEAAESAATSDAQPAATGAHRTKSVASDLKVAAVERGRITSLGGLTVLIWLVILVFMAWQ